MGDTLTNAAITVRLSPVDVHSIDKKIMEGYFTSRSDVIRYSIRYLMNELDAKERNLSFLREKAIEKGISLDGITEAVRTARKEVYREVYGDD